MAKTTQHVQDNRQHGSHRQYGQGKQRQPLLGIPSNQARLKYSTVHLDDDQ